MSVISVNKHVGLLELGNRVLLPNTASMPVSFHAFSTLMHPYHLFTEVLMKLVQLATG